MPGVTDEFLIERDPVRWSAPEGFPASLQPAGLFAQDTPSGLEVVLVETARRPNAPVMRRAWSKRRAGRASPVLRERGRHLVERLGYSVQPLGINTSMLTIGGRNRAIAVFCDEEEPFDAPARRFEGASPVSRGLAVADQ